MFVKGMEDCGAWKKQGLVSCGHVEPHHKN